MKHTPRFLIPSQVPGLQERRIGVYLQTSFELHLPFFPFGVFTPVICTNQCQGISTGPGFPRHFRFKQLYNYVHLGCNYLQITIA